MPNRQRTSFAVIAVLLIGSGVMLAGNPEGIAGCFHRWSVHDLIAFACLVFACLWGVAALISNHRSALAVTQQIKSSAADLKLTRVDRGQGLLVPVADALNELLDATESAVARAKLQVKEPGNPVESSHRRAAARRSHHLQHLRWCSGHRPV